MAQNMFTYGKKQEEFTDEDAKLEFERIEAELLEQMHQFELPDALSAENMMRLIDGVTPGVTQPARVINYKKEYTKFIAYAACLVLVITGFARMVKGQNDMIMVADASVSGAFGASVEESAVMMKAAAPAALADTAPAEAAPKASNALIAETTTESDTDSLDRAVAHSDKAADGNMLIMVNGVLYKSSGVMFEALGVDYANDEICMTVAAEGTPTADGESNFGAGYEYRVNIETVEVLIDGAWYQFVKA